MNFLRVGKVASTKYCVLFNMKTIRTLLLILIIHKTGHCQTIFTADKLTTGIYKDFNEFISNKPSISLNEIFIDENEIDLYYDIRGFLIYEAKNIKLKTYRLKDISTKKKIETKNYWGFSDGVNVYINSYSHIPKHFFVKINLIGRYCYFLQEGESSNYGSSTTGPSYPTAAEYIINVNNGIIYKLDKNLLKVIIQKDQELLNEFNNDPDLKRKLLMDYIDKYNKRHMDQIKALNINAH